MAEANNKPSRMSRWLDTLSETEVGELGDLLGRRFPRTLARLTGKAISEMGGAYAGAIGAAGRKVEEFSESAARGYEKMGEAVGSLGRSDAPSTEEIRQRIQELEERGAGGEQPTFREGQPASVPPPSDLRRSEEAGVEELQDPTERHIRPWDRGAAWEDATAREKYWILKKKDDPMHDKEPPWKTDLGGPSYG